jgi:putative transposase
VRERYCRKKVARKLRIQFPDAIYLVTNRGNRGEVIFRDDQDRRRFLGTLGEVCAKTDWQIIAYCLMKDHFHLVLRTPGANLVSGMKWFLGTYTSRFNRRHRLSGHHFGGRYKAVIVDGRSGGYLRAVCDYVHLNPARAKLLKQAEPLRAYAWTSFPCYLASPALRPCWLRTAQLLLHESAAERKRFEEQTERVRRADNSADLETLRRGWYFGADDYRRELLACMAHQMREHHYGLERHETATEKADQIIREELAKVGWDEEELGRRPKGDPVKLAAAVRLRQETTATLQWISHRLKAGAWTYLNKRLYEWRKTSGNARPQSAP